MESEAIIDLYIEGGGGFHGTLFQAPRIRLARPSYTTRSEPSRLRFRGSVPSCAGVVMMMMMMRVSGGRLQLTEPLDH